MRCLCFLTCSQHIGKTSRGEVRLAERLTRQEDAGPLSPEALYVSKLGRLIFSDSGQQKNVNK